MAVGNAGKAAKGRSTGGAGAAVFTRCVDDGEVAALRRAYLEAFPIPSVFVGEVAGEVVALGSNAGFDRLNNSGREAVLDAPIDSLPMLKRGGLAAVVRNFVKSNDRPSEFTWQDGRGVGARHFFVRLARLPYVEGLDQRCLMTLVERTAEIESERSLRAEMLHDSLTGLPNRVAFTEAVETAMTAQAEGRGGFAVVVVDLERFSQLNDCMGTLVGDELIITVARRLVSGVRPGDKLARLGGDEFGILLSAVESSDDALKAAQRVLESLSSPVRMSELQIRVGVAIGVALPSEAGGSGDDVVRNAQFALKRAKGSGRIEFYHSAEATAARRRFILESELRRAIETDALTLAFQPLVDLFSGRVIGFEALARWQHPEFGNVCPTEFIAVAEESGLIVPLGRWALSAAVETLAEWDRRSGQALPCYVAVNMSALQLARDDIAEAVTEVLERNGIEGRRLTIELTESVIVKNPERATRVLAALKALDVRIAMDDFGTGYSSLSYLQKLPIDVLKIDRSFVSVMLDDRDSVAIVRAVLSLANALGMETTGEGVETKALADTLAALGCSVGQGYYFAPPLTADAALDYFGARSA